MNFCPLPSPLPGMRIWRADVGNYSFVISQEMEVDDPAWSGFTASWKNKNSDVRAFGKQPANRIDGGPWGSFIQAENACKETWKQLRRKQ